MGAVTITAFESYSILSRVIHFDHNFNEQQVRFMLIKMHFVSASGTASIIHSLSTNLVHVLSI